MPFGSRSFAAGELAPELYARTDTVKYAQGLRTARNVIVQRQGGVTARPGTEYIYTLPAGAARLVPFVFNDTQSYVLVFTNNLVTVVQNGAVVTSGGVNVTVATSYAAADLAALRFVQSADTLTITHPSYAPAALKRVSQTNWTLTTITFGTSGTILPGLATLSGTAAGGHSLYYAVSFVDAATGAESLPRITPAIAVALPTVAVPITVSFPLTGKDGYYRVYRAVDNPPYALLGELYYAASASSPQLFADGGIVGDYTQGPVTDRLVFTGSNLYPTAVTYFQARLVFGGSNTYPYRVWATRTGDFANLNVSQTSAADDAVTFDISSRKVNNVQHLVDVGFLVALTTGGEYVVNGDANGVLTPSSVNLRCYSEHGASALVPLRVDQRLLYVQARRSTVRDVAVDPSVNYSGFRGRDLTVFATHLFDGFTLSDWTYAEVPHSLVWAVRSDGALLCLTLIDEQQIMGWTRHDTLGTVKNVCAIPEGGEDRCYVLVNRANGLMLERMRSQFFTNIATDAAYLDSAQFYDGRNTDGTSTMRLTGGTTWGATDTLTCTASAYTFTPASVGAQVRFTAASGLYCYFTISAYVSPHVVQGRATAVVPSDLQGGTTTAWAYGPVNLSGLSHLNGQAVSVIADGNVLASPNNGSYPVLTVASGALTLPTPMFVGFVGLPYTMDVQTLDFDVADATQTVKGNAILNNRVILMVKNTRGLWIAQSESDPTTDALPQTGFTELKNRRTEALGAPTALYTGAIEAYVAATWSASGRVFIRQVDPLPMTIQSIMPFGAFPRAG